MFVFCGVCVAPDCAAVFGSVCSSNGLLLRHIEQVFIMLCPPTIAARSGIHSGEIKRVQVLESEQNVNATRQLKLGLV